MICPSSEVSAASSPRAASVHSFDSTPLATPIATPLVTPKREAPATPKISWAGEDHAYYCSSPDVNDEALLLDERVVEGVKIRTKKSTKNAIKLVMQRNVQNNGFQVQEMVVHDGSRNKEAFTPQAAIKALNTKTCFKVRIMIIHFEKLVINCR